MLFIYRFAGAKTGPTMDVHDQIRRMRRPHVMVEMTIEVSEATAFWLLWIAEMHGDKPQAVAARILDDVVAEDELAHSNEILQ